MTDDERAKRIKDLFGLISQINYELSTFTMSAGVIRQMTQDREKHMAELKGLL